MYAVRPPYYFWLRDVIARGNRTDQVDCQDPQKRGIIRCMATQLPDNKVELDETLKRRIDELAQTNGVSPAEIVREAVEEFAAKRNGGHAVAPSDSIWDLAARVTASVPDEEWDKLPTDLAKNFEHYRYGYPRED